jgi:hypothetical protein
MNVPRAYLVGCFFTAFFAVGVLVSDDFGTGWDEPMHRQQGRRMLEYVTEGNPRGVQHHMRYHGPLVDTTLYFLESKLGLEDPYDVYRMRHLCYFLIFFCGVYFFFRLVERVWGPVIGLVGALFLVTSPRIFADSFYNPKDVPCLALFVVSIYTMVRYLERRTLGSAALHAVATALLLAVRSVGVLVPLLTVGGLLLSLVSRRQETYSPLRTAATLLFYLVLGAGLTVLLWPTLWRDPLFHAARAFSSMTRYGGWPGKVLYFGEHISAEALPWHYVPVWIAISTPASYLILGAVGFGILLKRIVENPLDTSPARVLMLAALVWFFGPLAAIIALESVVYDGWRHAFFVYPALLLLALFGLVELLRRPRWRVWVAGVAALDVAATLSFLILYHPHQNAYFNPIVRMAGGAEGRFDIDYWGLSYRAGLEHVLASEEGPVQVAVGNSPGVYNANLLPRRERDRLVFVAERTEAEYFLTNFRFSRETTSPGEEVFSIRVSGNRVLSVYRVQETTGGLARK